MQDIVAAKRVDLTYTSTGEVSTLTRYANLAGTQLVAASTYGYDANSNATSLSTVQGATTLASYTWTYDHIGRLTVDTIGTVSDSYTYDATGQETAATHSGGGNEANSYDANGNRTNTGDTTTTNNELSSDGTYNYTYDNEGNLIKKTTIATGSKPRVRMPTGQKPERRRKETRIQLADRPDRGRKHKGRTAFCFKLKSGLQILHRADKLVDPFVDLLPHAFDRAHSHFVDRKTHDFSKNT